MRHYAMFIVSYFMVSAQQPHTMGTISSLVWQVKNLKHNGVQDFRTIKTTPSFEIRQSDSRTDVFTREAPQQMYSSTVPCATYSHLWQKDLLGRALTLPFRKYELQVLVQFLILSQSWVVFYNSAAFSPAHAVFCDMCPKNNWAYVWEVTKWRVSTSPHRYSLLRGV